MSPRAWDPDPFTGLRVGIAAARAFALGRGIPVVPVVSHDAVALEILLRGRPDRQRAPTRFAVVTDARRREFAFTVYDGIDDDGLPVRATEPALIPRDELDARLAELGAERRDAGRGLGGDGRDRRRPRGRRRPRCPPSTEPLYLRSPDVTHAARPEAGHRSEASAAGDAATRDPRRPRRDHGARARVVPDRRLVGRDDARGARLAARLVRRRRGGRPADRLRRAARARAGQRMPTSRRSRSPRASRGRGRGRALLTALLERGRAPRRARRLPRGAGRQSGRAGAVRVGGLRRGRAPAALLPARRRRRDRDAARPARLDGRATGDAADAADAGACT